MFIIIYIMGKSAVVLLPSIQKILNELGESIKLARLRRGFSSELIAERSGISRATLVNVEKGSPSVAMGIYMRVLNALGLEKDMLLVAKDDELGRKLQDLKLVTRKRPPKEKKEQ